MLGEAPGYRSRAHAEAVRGEGRVVPLGATGGFLIERPIAGAGRTDLAGPYPLFACADWGALGPALDALAAPNGPVAVTLVADPFGPLPPARLAALFPLCRPLHDRHVLDLDAHAPPSRHHRRKLRGASSLRIEDGPAALAPVGDWVRLHGVLAARHGIRDRRRFDAASLAAQLRVPGAWIVTAWEGEEVLGADLYYLDGPVASAHLSAYSDRGYALSASYPMMAHAIEALRGRARWLDLGGAPPGATGMRAFKAGWAPRTIPDRLCGRILDGAAYAALAGPGDAGWFPAYRRGEFGPA